MRKLPSKDRGFNPAERTNTQTMKRAQLQKKIRRREPNRYRGPETWQNTPPIPDLSLGFPACEKISRFSSADPSAHRGDLPVVPRFNQHIIKRCMEKRALGLRRRIDPSIICANSARDLHVSRNERHTRGETVPERKATANHSQGERSI